MPIKKSRNTISPLKDKEVHKWRPCPPGQYQVTLVSRKALGDIKGELKDHLIHVDLENITDPVLNIAAGTRWLFQKKYLAGNRLGRVATWDEGVAEYKSYLKDMIKDPRYLNKQAG